MSAGFDLVAVIDWSGGRDRGARPRKDAIWAAVATRNGGEAAPVYLRNRAVAEDWIRTLADTALAEGRRLLVGLDFPFGYPRGFAAALTGREDVFALWAWFAAHVEDATVPGARGDAGSDNRFALAGRINRLVGDGNGPFWFNALKRDVDGLPRKGRTRSFCWPEPKRAAERESARETKGAFEVWQMAGAGAVGSQTFMGLPVLARLRARYGAALAVAPFEPEAGGRVVLAEVWPSLIGPAIARARRPGEIPDAAQVRVLARALAALPPEHLAKMLAEGREHGAEGWILGLGHAAALAEAVAAGDP